MNYEDAPKPEEIYKGEPSTQPEKMSFYFEGDEQVINDYYEDLKQKILRSSDLQHLDKLVLERCLRDGLKRVIEEETGGQDVNEKTDGFN